jgi:hypothetical protein
MRLLSFRQKSAFMVPSEQQSINMATYLDCAMSKKKFTFNLLNTSKKLKKLAHQRF